jgi:hypothetical protein
VLAALPGCGMVGVMAENYKRTSTHSVEGEYTGLAGKSFAVVVQVGQSIEGQYPGLRDVLLGELRAFVAVGEEGRGVRTIIDMVAMTRFDCLVGSSGGIRAATVQALYHCVERSAFGRRLVDQPLMQNVLADLTLESEAATALSMRMARALDHECDEGEALLVRLGTGLGKYWDCIFLIVLARLHIRFLSLQQWSGRHRCLRVRCGPCANASGRRWIRLQESLLYLRL